LYDIIKENNPWQNKRKRLIIEPMPRIWFC